METKGACRVSRRTALKTAALLTGAVGGLAEAAAMGAPPVGSEKKQPASQVAKLGFQAMMKGEGDMVTGRSNKLRAAISHIVPSSVLAEQHRKTAAPGTAKSAHRSLTSLRA
ncbi:MAG TPA: hypothetical protein VH374_13505 [Polyangia bacterium]|jgi:hypothetical protein|nr:hypothetical protein [Polyangia bacterium]